MSEALTKNEAQYRESRAIACQWGPAWLHAVPAKSPQPKETSAVTADSAATSEHSADAPFIACQTAGDGDNPFIAPAEFAAYSESCWADVFPDDYRSLTGPRNYPSPCPWCGGRLHHHPACDALRADWEPKMPFGKHKGHRVSQVPKDYLRWVLVHCTGIESELRQAIEDQLTRPSRS